MDSGGNKIPIVTTGGNYGYLGRVTLNFNSAGQLSAIDNTSGPQRVASTTADATHGVAADPDVQSESIAPVQSFVASLAATKLAKTSVQLLHGGSPTIRSRETNLGNIVADGILRAAQVRSGSFNVDSPVIAMVNGGGIRANINTGDVTQLDTFNVSPFGNFVSVVEDVKLADIKLLLENGYSRTTNSGAGINPVGTDGRFTHIAGMEIVYDINEPGYRFTSSGSTIAGNPATRIREISIGGTTYLEDGMWLVDPNAVTFDIATLAFLAGGGDQYFRTQTGGTSTYLSQLYDFTTLGLSDQNALEEYIRYMAGGNANFDISTFLPEYAITQSFVGGRITVVPEPMATGAIASVCFVLMRRRK